MAKIRKVRLNEMLICMNYLKIPIYFLELFALVLLQKNMLNRRKKSREKNLSKTEKTNSGPAITYITESTTITADMICEDDVRVAGTIDGKLESKKKVILTESGIVNGEIVSPSADISGKVDGDIRAQNKLTLRSSAVIDGDITTDKIKIEQGAQVKGVFQVGKSVSSSAKISS
ncbi:MAG TPA: polymer-forming cytoskeletal protein [Balneolaceae bacterium]|nr:polymer-forming cytoskeletal protein [Balneolaceae bacterium]